MYELRYKRRRLPQGLVELTNEGNLAKYEEVSSIKMIDEEKKGRNGKKGVNVGFKIGVYDPENKYTLDTIFYEMLNRMLARVAQGQREGLLDGLELYLVTSNGSGQRKPNMEEMTAYECAMQKLKKKNSDS